ncbi:MAG: acetate uptake transporter [Candidatus Methanomethylicaceae archaeon]|jgi:succinate-acetate transporter protein
MSNTSEKAMLGDPAPLGLSAFAITTFLLSFANAGLLPASTVAVVMPLAFTYGGITQLITGAFEMRKGNTFGFTAFTSYGAFWIFYAMLVFLKFAGIINPPASAVGMALILWGVFSLYMWIPTLNMNLTLTMTFFFLWLTFFSLGGGDLAGNSSLTQVGGYLGFLTAGFAAYTSFAIVTNSVMGSNTLPLGPRVIKRT